MEMQQRHELIIDLLKKHPSFQQPDGTCRYKKRKKQLASHELKDLDINEVNGVVILIAEVLNMTGGSIGGSHDLYKLLQAYFTIPACRPAMDAIAHKAIMAEV